MSMEVRRMGIEPCKRFTGSTTQAKGVGDRWVARAGDAGLCDVLHDDHDDLHGGRVLGQRFFDVWCVACAGKVWRLMKID
jgi:hypothetical protein